MELECKYYARGDGNEWGQLNLPMGAPRFQGPYYILCIIYIYMYLHIRHRSLYMYTCIYTHNIYIYIYIYL